MRKQVFQPKWQKNQRRALVNVSSVKEPVASGLTVEEIDEMLTNLDFLESITEKGDANE